MTTASTSTLTWLDSSERERQSVLQLVSALNEPGTLDELGVGTIRDMIVDALYLGTSLLAGGESETQSDASVTGAALTRRRLA